MNGRAVEKKDGFPGELLIVVPTEGFQDYAEDTQVSRLYLTDVGFFPQAAEHYRERPEGIEEYILLCCIEGSGFIEIGRRTYRLEASQAFCIPAGESHRYYASEEDPWSIYWVHFRGSDSALYPLDACEVIRFTSELSMNRMIFIFGLLFRVLDGNYTLGNFRYISSVLGLLLSEIYFREKPDTAVKQNKYVTAIVRYMYEHIGRQISLDEIAETFDISRSYLNEIFQACTQHSPIDFYIRIKMKEACKYLRNTDLYIYEIAERLGYADQYYFSRLFSKTVGLPPRDYRNGDYSFGDE